MIFDIGRGDDWSYPEAYWPLFLFVTIYCSFVLKGGHHEYKRESLRGEEKKEVSKGRREESEKRKKERDSQMRSFRSFISEVK